MRLKSFCVALFLLLPVPAQALCVGTGVSATAVAFGTYDPSAKTPTITQGQITVQCTVGVLTGFSVALSKGMGTYALRTMTYGSNALGYNLYTDGTYGTVWGDGTSGTGMQNFDALISLGSITYNVFGVLGTGQYPAPGTYTDSITVTVTF